MQGMRGVSSKIPRGWRNIQAVHLKTIHSIALPLYTSLPPEPKLLAPSDGAPKRKRVKLEDTAPAGTIGRVYTYMYYTCMYMYKSNVDQMYVYMYMYILYMYVLWYIIPLSLQLNIFYRR